MSVRAESLRIAAVGFVNARPLIAGLEREAGLSLDLDVPSGLLGRLEAGSADVALLPVIDLQRMPGLRVIPAGGIGCKGPTLTVRLFARRPLEEIETLAVDPDSHTSVVLSRVVLKRLLGLSPRIVDLREATDSPAEARLLIGDKVVCEEPVGFEYQLDLGAAWKSLTGLPFVFAVWCVRQGVAVGDLATKLSAARERGLAHVDEIIEKYAVPRGWPRPIAKQYLTSYLKFGIGPEQINAIRLFHRYAAEDGLIENPPMPLIIEDEATVRA